MKAEAWVINNILVEYGILGNQINSMLVEYGNLPQVIR